MSGRAPPARGGAHGEVLHPPVRQWSRSRERRALGEPPHPRIVRALARRHPPHPVVVFHRHIPTIPSEARPRRAARGRHSASAGVERPHRDPDRPGRLGLCTGERTRHCEHVALRSANGCRRTSSLSPAGRTARARRARAPARVRPHARAARSAVGVVRGREHERARRAHRPRSRHRLGEPVVTADLEARHLPVGAHELRANGRDGLRVVGPGVRAARRPRRSRPRWRRGQ